MSDLPAEPPTEAEIATIGARACSLAEKNAADLAVLLGTLNAPWAGEVIAQLSDAVALHRACALACEARIEALERPIVDANVIDLNSVRSRGAGSEALLRLSDTLGGLAKLEVDDDEPEGLAVRRKLEREAAACRKAARVVSLPHARGRR